MQQGLTGRRLDFDPTVDQVLPGRPIPHPRSFWREPAPYELNTSGALVLLKQRSPGNERREYHLGEFRILRHQFAKLGQRHLPHLTRSRDPRGQIDSLARDHVQLAQEHSRSVGENHGFGRTRHSSPNQVDFCRFHVEKVASSVTGPREHLAHFHVPEDRNGPDLVYVTLAQYRKGRVGTRHLGPDQFTAGRRLSLDSADRAFNRGHRAPGPEPAGQQHPAADQQA